LHSKALILDNNPINSELLTEVLSQIDVSSKVLYNPSDFFKTLAEESFDLIFLDVMIPFMDGYKVMEELSKNPVYQNIPVIFLSALAETKNIVKGLELGCYDYITKPYRIEELQAKIKNIIKLKKLQDERECFIETVTHDLKTPVRSEIRAMELLLNGYFGELNQTQTEILSEILNSSNYMFFMLDSILSKHKLDQNKIKLVPVKFNLGELVRDCTKELNILFETKKQSINLCFESQTEEISADYIAIKRILMNLISNAIKFSKEGSMIEVRVFDEGNEVKVSVIDNGIGIAPSELNNIFEYKKDNVKKFKQVGSGLGLYISKKIIALHGGEISVDSSKGKGSVFTISLPKSRVCSEKKEMIYG